MSTTGLGLAYGRLWSATTLSSFGGGVSAAALPLLAAASTSEPALVAGVSVAVELPWLLFGLVAGAVVDRVDARRLVTVVNVAEAFLVAGLATAVATDRAGLAVTYVIAFCCGTCGTLSSTATTTMTPRLVDVRQLDRANGQLITAASAGGELLGPPLGGYLFGIAAATPLAFHAGTSVLCAALVASLPNLFGRTQLSHLPAQTIWRDIADGARWLARHRQLRAMAMMSAVFALTDSAWFAIMVLYVRDILDLPAAAYGLLVGVGAFGGLLGGLTAARLTRAIPSTGTLLPALLVAAAGAQAVLAFTTHVVLTTGSLAVSSFAFGVWNVVTVTQRQKLTPSQLLGRVTSAERTAIMGASPLGALLGGLAASGLGIRAPFVLGLPVILVGAVLGWLALRTPPGKRT